MRMTGAQRREQLITVGRHVFAERGVAGATVEEIAAAAGVTKPVVYEHFGGKEGLYAVVVDREMRAMLDLLSVSLVPGESARLIIERAAVAVLTYIEESPDGFRVLSRDSPPFHTGGSLGSLMSEIATQVEHVLVAAFKNTKLDPKFAPIYAQMLLGAIALTGAWWLETNKEFKKEDVAAHMVDLAWNGLVGLEPEPRLNIEL